MRVAPSEADFLFFESEIELYHSLLDAGVLIRDCRNYRGMEPGVHHYRVAVRRSMENEQLIWLIRDLRR